MFSSLTFQLDQNGAVHYEPNKEIRTVTVYKNKIEYDVFFNTNNLGFVDDKDYEYDNAPDKRHSMLLLATLLLQVTMREHLG